MIKVYLSFLILFMDYLDPKKNQRNILMLKIGYLLIAISIGVMVLILNYLSNGYNYNNGEITQQGMIYLASQPSPANIYINNKLNSAQTNARIFLNSGSYNFTIKKTNYRSWSHEITIPGGMVVNYLYPFLFPNVIPQKKIFSYASAPTQASESPSQQYVITTNPSNFNSFYLYDLNSGTITPKLLTLPSGLISPAQTSQSWKFIAWANDNTHLLVEHIYDGNTEFMELDTSNISSSININQTFSITPTTVSLNNLDYNSFYFYNSATQTLSTANLSNINLVNVASSVLAYKSYLTSIFLYVSSVSKTSSEASVYLNDAGTNYFLQNINLAPTYLLNMANYNGNDYVVVGGSNNKYLDIYENPQLLAQSSTKAIVPFRILDIPNASYESFAPTAQFIVAENGQNVIVYDIKHDNVDNYNLAYPLTSGESSVHWMDGDRLYYIGNNLIQVFDFDNTNQQTLTSALPGYRLFFNNGYTDYYSISLNPKTNHIDFMQNSLIAK